MSSCAACAIALVPRLKRGNVAFPRDGERRGGCIFHQTLKNEEVYWKLYQAPAEARESLEIFRRRYNEVRPHWALVPQGGGDVLTPADVYVHGQAVELPKWQGWAKAAKEKLQQLIQGARLPEATAQALEAAA